MEYSIHLPGSGWHIRQDAKEAAINGAIERWLYDDKEEYELQKIWERDNERYELQKSWERYNERCKERFKEDEEAAIKYLKLKDISSRNLRCFANSFQSRTDISEKLKSSLLCDTLLLVGDQVSNNEQTCRR